MKYHELRLIISKDSVTCSLEGSTVPIRGIVRCSPTHKKMIEILSRLVAAKKVTEREEIQLLGELLFDVLFDLNVAKRFWDEVEKGTALRLLLHFEPDAAELKAMPWEYLHLPQGERYGKGYFLSSRHRLVLARHVPVAIPMQVVDEGELRVLVVVCEPKNQGMVLSDKVIAGIKSIPNTLVECPDGADWASCRAKMSKFFPHVVHFFGHGVFDPEKGGALHFVDKVTRQKEVVDERRFAAACEEFKPRLVFLQACESAGNDSQNAFAGMAMSLVGSRIPAVVAMQHKITNDSAELFATTLYQRLAAGELIDAAVQAGRQALEDRVWEADTACEFGTPVVYIPTQDQKTTEMQLVKPRAAAGDAQGSATQEGADAKRGPRCPFPGDPNDPSIGPCKKRVRPGRGVCPECRTRYVTCSACGGTSVEGELKCTCCGEPLAQVSGPPDRAAPKAPSSRPDIDSLATPEPARSGVANVAAASKLVACALATCPQLVTPGRGECPRCRTKYTTCPACGVASTVGSTACKACSKALPVTFTDAFTWTSQSPAR